MMDWVVNLAIYSKSLEEDPTSSSQMEAIDAIVGVLCYELVLAEEVYHHHHWDDPTLEAGYRELEEFLNDTRLYLIAVFEK